jgi:hypothetical protein
MTALVSGVNAFGDGFPHHIKRQFVFGFILSVIFMPESNRAAVGRRFFRRSYFFRRRFLFADFECAVHWEKTASGEKPQHNRVVCENGFADCVIEDIGYVIHAFAALGTNRVVYDEHVVPRLVVRQFQSVDNHAVEQSPPVERGVVHEPVISVFLGVQYVIEVLFPELMHGLEPDKWNNQYGNQDFHYGIAFLFADIITVEKIAQLHFPARNEKFRNDIVALLFNEFFDFSLHLFDLLGKLHIRLLSCAVYPTAIIGRIRSLI